MGKNRNIEKTIRIYTFALIAFTLLSLAAMLLILQNTSHRTNEVDQLENSRETCSSAISTFSDGSDYLTNEVWAYATSGDISHMLNYWNEVVNTRSRDEAIETLLHSGLTVQEKTHVLRAKAYSDTLISGETWSMRLLAESFGVQESDMPARVQAVELTDSEEALPAEGKRQKAQDYLFGEDYAESKTNIRSMISAFNTDLSLRLANATTATLTANEIASRYSFAAIVLLMLLIALLIYNYSRIVREKNKMLTDALQEAQAASTAKSYFTSRMSHEIRTPLNAVLGYLHIAETTDNKWLLDTSIQKSKIAATNLLGIVNDVLDLSAIESGKMQLLHEEYSISSLLQDIRIVYSGLAAEKGLNLTVTEDGVTRDLLTGDRMRINQILTNLLSNAVKFTPSGGQVSLSVRQETTNGKFQTVYSVRDTGIGMNAEFLPHIFAAYEQEDASIHRRFGGSGLGMSIAKNLAEIMGGTITVESEKGKGSVFTVALPDAPAAENAIVENSPEHDGNSFSEENTISGMRILLVEDNEMNIEIAELLLKRAGAVVTTARNGCEALELYLRSPEYAFDAVLMDIIMPEMDGFEATRRIRASGRADASSLPIIAMSANAFASDVQHSLDAGMNAHTAKPIDIRKLIAVLKQYTGK